MRRGGPQTSTIITQSTVDLNMLMDIIETVFDRPNINTFVLMTGDRDFTRISARLKLRLNKRVIVWACQERSAVTSSAPPSSSSR